MPEDLAQQADDGAEEGKASHFPLAKRTRQLVDGEVVPSWPNAYFLMLPKSATSRLPSGILVGDGHGDTTSNYEAMAIATEWVRVLRGGPPPPWIPASAAAEYLAFCRARVLRLLKEELETRGLMRGEQLAVDPHAELHLAPHALLRIGAREARDAEILKLSDEWWGRYLDVAAACVAPSGLLCHAGARAKSHPVSTVGSAILASVTRCVPFRDPGKSSTALDAVLGLLADGDTFGGRARETRERDFHLAAMRRLPEVKLSWPMVVERGADWLRSYVPEKPERAFHLRDLFASYVEVRFGPEPQANKLHKAGRLIVVKGWATPFPDPPSKVLHHARTH